MSLAVAAVMCLIMWTWVRGSRCLFDKTRKSEVPLDLIVRQHGEQAADHRAGDRGLPHQRSDCAPTALLHSLKHYKVLHETNVILTIETSASPACAGRGAASGSSGSTSTS